MEMRAAFVLLRDFRRACQGQRRVTPKERFVGIRFWLQNGAKTYSPFWGPDRKKYHHPNPYTPAASLLKVKARFPTELQLLFPAMIVFLQPILGNLL